MVRVTLAAALIVIALTRHRRHNARLRGRERPIVSGDCGDARKGSETVHAEQTQQQSTHEQPTGPQCRLRSSKLSEARHGLIVSTDHWSRACRPPPEETRRGNTHPEYLAPTGGTVSDAMRTEYHVSGMTCSHCAPRRSGTRAVDDAAHELTGRVPSVASTREA